MDTHRTFIPYTTEPQIVVLAEYTAQVIDVVKNYLEIKNNLLSVWVILYILNSFTDSYISSVFHVLMSCML